MKIKDVELFDLGGGGEGRFYNTDIWPILMLFKNLNIYVNILDWVWYK